MIELNSKLTNVTKAKVIALKNHYGSFGIRGSGVWRKAEESKFDFLTSKAKNRKSGNLSNARWAAMSGVIDGKVCGVAVIGSQKNFRSPQPVRLHPTMPYFSFAPMATAPFDLNPDEPYESTFRIVTFDGKPDPEKLNRLANF